jgi:hypothetical protein
MLSKVLATLPFPRLIVSTNIRHYRIIKYDVFFPTPTGWQWPP